MPGEDAREPDRRELLDTLAFWESRHRSSDEWRSAGDRGLGPAENREFYALRVGMLISLIRRHFAGIRPLFVLDAGCGRGHISTAMSSFGHRVDGIDFSEFAVGYCRENAQGEFHQSSLAEYRPGRLYDVVLCVDVLFHILEDAEWAASLRNLATLTRAGGILIVADVFGSERHTLSDYIVHRPMAEYEQVLGPLGLSCVAREPYGFGANPNSLAVFARDL